MDLSPRQQGILEFIRSYTREHGYPPSIREIGNQVGISSTSVVNYNLKVLERKHVLERHRDISRGLRLTEEAEKTPRISTFSVPLLGRIAAGEPIPVPDSDFSTFDSEMISLTRDIVSESEGVYALQVKGESMIDALIHDGDIVVMQDIKEAKNGDMVAAWLKTERETTLKRFYWEPDHRLIRLQPANPSFSPIYVDPANLEIQGKVIAVIRHIQ